MGVYIKGMEMPTEGTVIAIYKLNGKFYASVHGTDLCPLVDVPPHGRLVDESWLKKAMITTLEVLKKNPKMDGQEMHLIAAFDTLRAMVEDAPTVIEAEEGD